MQTLFYISVVTCFTMILRNCIGGYVYVCRWLFAYSCILEETVRRRRRMWSWDVIKAHRDMCKKYQDLYKSKLLTKKPSSQLLADLEVCVALHLLEILEKSMLEFEIRSGNITNILEFCWSF